jgi:hypothetical protein
VGCRTSRHCLPHVRLLLILQLLDCSYFTEQRVGCRTSRQGHTHFYCYFLTTLIFFIHVTNKMLSSPSRPFRNILPTPNPQPHIYRVSGPFHDSCPANYRILYCSSLYLLYYRTSRHWEPQHWRRFSKSMPPYYSYFTYFT